MNRKKLVVVGDNGSMDDKDSMPDRTNQKTALVTALAKGSTDGLVHISGVFNSYPVDVIIEGKTIELGLWDTAGQESYDRLRPLSYPDTDIVVICFNIVNLSSLNNVIQKWNPEINHFCPKVKKILVGLVPVSMEDFSVKIEEMVTAELGNETAQKIGAVCYIECSPHTGEGVKELLHVAAEETLRRKPKRKRRCHLL